jgi:hypothetical protein
MGKESFHKQQVFLELFAPAPVRCTGAPVMAFCAANDLPGMSKQNVHQMFQKWRLLFTE